MCAACLDNCGKFYNYNAGTISLEEVQNRLEKLQNTYSKEFVYFLATMLEFNDRKRPDLNALTDKFNIAFTKPEQVSSYLVGNEFNFLLD